MERPDEDKIEGLAIILANPQHVSQLLWDLLRYKRAFFKSGPFQTGDRIKATRKVQQLSTGIVLEGAMGRVKAIDYVVRNDGDENWEVSCEFDEKPGTTFIFSWDAVQLVYERKSPKNLKKKSRSGANRQKRLSRGRKS